MSELSDYLQFCRDKAEVCTEIWATAHQEYAHEDYLTFNFDETAKFLSQNPRLKDITPYDVAVALMTKHMFSVAKQNSLREDLSGRFTDIHNYLFIMEWMLNKKKVPEPGADGHWISNNGEAEPFYPPQREDGREHNQEVIDRHRDTQPEWKAGYHNLSKIMEEQRKYARQPAAHA